MTEKFKVCMIGATAVGKTSLVARFVSSVFHARYTTTIGVRIQARRMQRGESSVDLIIWDLSGEDEFQSVQPSYLRGSTGYLLVIDGTRRETAATALILQERASRETEGAPFVVVLNKVDLANAWDVDESELAALQNSGSPIVRTSALSGAGVDEAFDLLATLMLERQGKTWK